MKQSFYDSKKVSWLYLSTIDWEEIPFEKLLGLLYDYIEIGQSEFIDEILFNITDYRLKDFRFKDLEELLNAVKMYIDIQLQYRYYSLNGITYLLEGLIKLQRIEWIKQFMIDVSENIEDIFLNMRKWKIEICYIITILKSYLILDMTKESTRFIDFIGKIFEYIISVGFHFTVSQQIDLLYIALYYKKDNFIIDHLPPVMNVLERDIPEIKCYKYYYQGLKNVKNAEKYAIEIRELESRCEKIDFEIRDKVFKWVYSDLLKDIKNPLIDLQKEKKKKEKIQNNRIMQNKKNLVKVDEVTLVKITLDKCLEHNTVLENQECLLKYYLDPKKKMEGRCGYYRVTLLYCKDCNRYYMDETIKRKFPKSTSINVVNNSINKQQKVKQSSDKPNQEQKIKLKDESDLHRLVDILKIPKGLLDGEDIYPNYQEQTNQQRKQRQIVTKEQRELVKRSEAVEPYPEILRLLNRFEKISESEYHNNWEIKRIINWNIDKFRAVFEDIVIHASQEWYCVSRYSHTTNEYFECELCGHKGIQHLFQIQNRLNKETLIVGSSCVGKFPELNKTLSDGQTMDSFMKQQIKNTSVTKRKGEFYERFPAFHEIFENWKQKVLNITYVLPKYMEEQKQKLITDTNKTLEQFFVGRAPKEQTFSCIPILLKEYSKFENQMDQFVKRQSNNPIACTQKVKNHLISQRKEEIIDLIEENNGNLTKEIVPFIYEKEFVLAHLPSMIGKIESDRFRHYRNIDNDIVFEFVDTKRDITVKLQCGFQTWMKQFGDILFETRKISEQELLNILEFVDDESTFAEFSVEVEHLLRGTEYYIYDDEEDESGQGIYLANRKLKSYASRLPFALFMKVQKNILILDKNEARKSLISSIKKIQKWSSLKELKDIQKARKNKIGS